MVISSKEATGQTSLFTFSHASKTFTRDEVKTWFRVTQEWINTRKKSNMNSKTMSKIYGKCAT